MKRAFVVATGLLLLGSSVEVSAENDGLGPYARVGGAVGWATSSFDGVSNGTNGGFNAGAGWRFTPALAAEFDIVFLTGGDVTVGAATGGTTEAVAGTVDLKVYPTMFSADDANGRFQLYGRMGIGGGSGELKDAGPFSGSSGSFLARFGGGLDLMLTDRLGAYADGSYFVTTEDVVSGIGVISIGGILRF